MRVLTRDLPNLDTSKIQVPDVDLSKVDLSRIDPPEVDLSKIDLSSVGKAVGDAAVAAGIVRRRRSPWRLVLGAAIIVGLASWAYRNSAAVQERLGRLATWVGDRVGAVRSPTVPAPRVHRYEPMTSVYSQPSERQPEMGGMPDEAVPSHDELRARA